MVATDLINTGFGDEVSMITVYFKTEEKTPQRVAADVDDVIYTDNSCFSIISTKTSP